MDAAEDVAAGAARARRWVDVATWTAIGLGLAFTAVNVQAFAAAGAPMWSPAWSVAWLLDPMVSVLLLAVVRAEQVTGRWQIAMPWQVAAVKWAAFAATYLMNTWAAWRDGIPSSVLLHSVPPVFVLLAAEVAPALRHRLTEAVRRAEAAPAGLADPEPLVEPALADMQATPEPADDPATEAAAVAPAPASRTAEGERIAPYDSALDAGVDARVREVAELLAAGCDVTGAQAAVLHGVSDRTGRRLLADARTYLEQHPIRPDLHLVEARTAGGTS